MNIICQIKDNKVINLVIAGDQEWINSLKSKGITCEPYDPNIHPWGPTGFLDIEIGPDWKNRLKQSLGYCIFCGDNNLV